MNKKLIFPALVLLTLMFILPFGSWYYLNSGLKYRKGIQKEIQVKSKFTESLVYRDIQALKPSTDINEFLSGKTSLIFSYTDNINKLICPIYEQFSKAEKFQIICLSQSEMPSPNWRNIVIGNSPQEEDKIHLVNHLGEYIGSYGLDNESMKSLVEHTAIVLPRKVEKDIVNKK